jgi:hypothetical protein
MTKTLTNQRTVYRRESDGWQRIPFRELRKGDKFAVIDSPTALPDEVALWQALDDPRPGETEFWEVTCEEIA